MVIAEYLIPNFNLDALIGIGIAILGIALVVIAFMFPIPFVSPLLSKVGVLAFLGGLVYWFGVSFVQDVFANTRLITTIAVLCLLGGIGYLLFGVKK